MEEVVEIEDEIPLPSMPSTPQKTLFSFFEKPKCPDKYKTKHGREHMKAHHESAKCPAKTDYLAENSENIENLSETASMIVPTLQPSCFPAPHHVQPQSTYSTECRKSNKLKMKPYSEEIISHLPCSANYRSLLNLKKSQPTIFTYGLDDEEALSIDDWLTQLTNQHPDFTIRKTFRHYLACQRSTILTNIKKMEASRDVVKSIWKKDAELQSVEIEQKKILQQVTVKKKTNDIRSMLAKAKTPKMKIKENEVKVLVSSQEIVSDSTKPVKVSTASLFEKARRSREQRRLMREKKKGEEENEDSKNEKGLDTVRSTIEIKPKRRSNDIRSLFGSSSLKNDNSRKDTEDLKTDDDIVSTNSVHDVVVSKTTLSTVNESVVIMSNEDIKKPKKRKMVAAMLEGNKKMKRDQLPRRRSLRNREKAESSLRDDDADRAEIGRLTKGQRSMGISEQINNCEDNATNIIVVKTAAISPNLKTDDKGSTSPTPNGHIDRKDDSVIFVDEKKKAVDSVVISEAFVNSCLTWTEKYQPSKARYVLGDVCNIRDLFDWLNNWKMKHDSIVKKLAALKQKVLNRSDSDDDDDEEEEDTLSNTLILNGPCGCGTTAAVVACASQMNFKILELNPSMVRSGKQIFERVSEAVVSHQITKLPQRGSFFNSTFSNVTSDAMTLVLFEQADIVYEELDKGFWQGIEDLRQLSKRPLILTANSSNLTINDDNDFVCTERISLSRPPIAQILPVIQLICLIEQTVVPVDVLVRIIKSCDNDVRKIIMQTQFWFDSARQPLYCLLKNQSSECDAKKQVATETDVTTTTGTSQCSEDDFIALTRRFKVPRNKVTGFSATSEEFGFDVDKLSKDESWNTLAHTHFSFIKCNHPKAACDLGTSGNILDCLSELDAYLHTGLTYEDKDFYPWYASMGNSLCDSWTTVKETGHPYPIEELTCSVRSSLKAFHSKVTNANDDALCYVQERLDPAREEIISSVQQRMPASSSLERRQFEMEVLPCLLNMCSSEESKRDQQKRRPRRFLHYLDSISLCLDQTAIRLLTDSPLLRL